MVIIQYVGGYSDLVYIPARYKNDAIEILKRLLEKNVFLEIAIPTLCGCLDIKENQECFKGLAMWGADRRELFRNYQIGLDYVHPFKFSQQAYRDFIHKQFELRKLSSRMIMEMKKGLNVDS